MHSLTKNLFWQNIFVADLEQTPFFLRSDLNINNFAVLYHFLKTLLNDQSFSSFHWKNLFDWLIFENEQFDWFIEFHINIT